jgi:FtsH-binding integral membrane protein
MPKNKNRNKSKKKSSKKDLIKKVAFWLTTLLGPVSFVIGGTLFLTHAQQPMEAMTHLGYPIYLLNILGFWKLAGAIVILIPGYPLLKEWAYAGFVFELTGAAASHFFAGDPFFAAGPMQVSTPLIFLIFVLASWYLRPDDRKIV